MLIGQGLPSGGGGGPTNHGSLTGLSNDDHPQYHNNARGDARYYTQSAVDSALAGKANTSHTHAISNVTGLADALDGKLWTEYVTKWSTAPTDVGAATVSGNPGRVFSYTYDSVTRYRFIADTYSATLDAFYSTYSGGVLSVLLAQRNT